MCKIIVQGDLKVIRVIMSRSRRTITDNKSDDFEYISSKKSAVKNTLDETADMSHVGVQVLDNSSATKGTPAVALTTTIKQLENRIQELEYEHLLQAESKKQASAKAKPKVSSDSTGLSLSDILQQTNEVEDFLSGKHPITTDNVSSIANTHAFGTTANSTKNRELEMGNINWQNQHEMLMFSLSSAHEKQAIRSGKAVVNASMKSFATTKTKVTPYADKNDRSTCCYLFNNDDKGCHFEKSADGCKKLHACSLCAARGFYNKHSALVHVRIQKVYIL